MTIVVIMMNGPLNQGLSDAGAIETESMTMLTTTTGGSAIASLALHERGLRHRRTGTRWTATRRRWWAPSAAAKKANLPTATEMHIAYCTYWDSLTRNLAAKRKLGVAIAGAPARVQINRAGTGDGEMWKAIADAVAKVTVEKMVVEGLTATSIRPSVVTKRIEQKRQLGTAGDAVLLAVLAVQAEADTDSNTLPSLVIEDFVTRRTPGVRTVPAPWPD